MRPTRREFLQSTCIPAVYLGLPLRALANLATEPQMQTGAAGVALAENFRNPPNEYRPVDNWWWEAARLSKEKLTWQLEEFKSKGAGGTWAYVRWVYGEGLSSIPKYWSDEWWDLMRFALQEHKRLGLDAWFSTWEENGFIQKRVLAEAEQNPVLKGRNLVMHKVESDRAGPLELTLAAGDEVLDTAAYKLTGTGVDYATRTAVSHSGKTEKVQWKAPAPGWLLTAIVVQRAGVDYLNPVMAKRWNEVFLGEYEKRLPEFMGTILKAFGVDEHAILSGNTLFSRTLLSNVKSNRGYDLTPYLIGLFYDIGSKTDQVRCEYYDAMSALIEANFCKVAARWLEDHGMEYLTASPHEEGELLDQTYLYGDLVRYFRSYHSVGGEDPTRTSVGERRLYSAKFASSIAHLYERKRAIVMAYFYSGWGVTQAENVAWTNENYAYGMNFYDRHGVFYTLMGGWYDYAPPGDHFYQPHWRYWRTFADYVTRLSFIMGQGKHRADVALLFPGTTIHANWIAGRQQGGNPWEVDIWKSFEAAAIETTERTKDLARALCQNGIDLDVMDDWSLQRATISNGVLKVSGVELRAIVMPPLTTIRIGTLQKIKEFYDSGGTIVSLGRLPAASAENGRQDPKVRGVIREMFGVDPDASPSQASSRSNENGGKAYFVLRDANEVPGVISNAIERDVVASGKDLFHTHQKIADRDAYFLFNAQDQERDLTIRFRVDAEAERWDAFTGDIQPVYRVTRDGRTTEVKLRMQPYEGAVLVFSPGRDRPAVLEDNLLDISAEATGDGLAVRGFAESSGKKRARILHRGQEHVAEGEIKQTPPPMDLGNTFDFHIEPTMDNRWGDFRYPAAPGTIGAEARTFRYFEEGDAPGTELGWHRVDFKDTDWPDVTYTYGPYWWQIGPFHPGSEPLKLLESAKNGEVDLAAAWPQLKSGELPLHWSRYSFSKKFGTAYYDKEINLSTLMGVPDNFLSFGKGASEAHEINYLFTNVDSPNEADYIFYLGGQPPMPLISGFPESHFVIPSRTEVWLNGEELLLVTAEDKAEIRKQVKLHKGRNSVLLKIRQPGGQPLGLYAVFLPGEPPSRDAYVPLLRWFREPQPLVYDIAPERTKRVGWYRFKAPPGLRSMRMKLQAGDVTAWVDGRSVPVHDGVILLATPLRSASQVVLRVNQEPGTYAGAVFLEPVAFTCEEGQMQLGDWSESGLASYSGIGVYGKEVTLGRRHLAGKVLLELGSANTAAEVFVNGKQAGVRLSRPFRFDITALVKEGSNQLQIKIANTLANHMSTYPTPWVLPDQTVSGLFGPVRLRFLSPVSLLVNK